ncbi:MAG: hypothetical protein FJX34_05695, partial [Alphaproteobacteria bacterium]|nr:hypothetical protein [Alphaproteobacteria bacterium]
EAFDGRVFTGRQALAIGLIDEVGGKDEALSYLAAQKIDTKKLPLRTIEIIQHENKFLDHIFGMIPFFDGTKTKNSNHKIMAVME